MFELLMAAILSGNKAETLRLLHLAPFESMTELCKKVDKKGHHLIHYLARYDDVESLRFLKDKIPLEMFKETVNLQTPILLAAKANARRVVSYFEAEKIDFLNHQQHEAIYGDGSSFYCEEVEILSPASPLLIAIGAGNLPASEVLLPLFFADAIVIKDVRLRVIYMMQLVSLAIENKQVHLFPLLEKHLRHIPLRARVDWLIENFVSLLSLGRNYSVIEYIEKNYVESASIIQMLFPYEDAELKKDLILSATQKACPNILRQLLSQCVVDDQIKEDIIRGIFEIAITLFEVSQNRGIYYFTGRDILDVAAVACAEQFDKYPNVLFEILKAQVIQKNVYILDALLRRVSSETRKIVFSHQFKGLTLSHIAVSRCSPDTMDQDAIDTAIILKQFGSPGDLTSSDGITVSELARVQAEPARTGRRISVAVLSEEAKKIEAKKQGAKNSAEIVSLTERHSSLNQKLRLLDQPTQVEIMATAIMSGKIPAKLVNQKIYFHTIGKITDSQPYDHNDLAMLHNVVSNLREMSGVNSKQNCVRGLLKALVNLTRQGTYNHAYRVYQQVSSEMSMTAKRKSLFEFIVHLVMVEQGVILEDYQAALSHLDHITEIADKIAEENRYSRKSYEEEVVFSGINIPQVILARLVINLCSALRVSIPSYMKTLLCYLSENKSALRILGDADGFSLQGLVGLLSVIYPSELSNEQLNLLWRGLLVFKRDFENYQRLSLTKEMKESEAFQKLMMRTYTDISYIFKWFCDAEKTLCPKAFEVPLVANESELKNIKLFLQVKSSIMLHLVECGKRLDQLLDNNYSHALAEVEKEYDNNNGQIKKINELLKNIEEKVGEVIRFPAINPITLALIQKKDNGVLNKLINSLDSVLLRISYYKSFTLADYLADKIIMSGNLEVLKRFLSRFSAKEREDIEKRLLSTAIDENKRELIKYLGGDPSESQHLFNLLPISLGDVSILLMRCFRARKLDRVPAILKLVDKSQLEKIVPALFEIVKQRYANPLEVLRPLVVLLGVDSIAKLAIQEGYTELLIGLIEEEKDKGKRVNLISLLLKYMAYEHNEQVEYEICISENAKFFSVVGENILANQQAAMREKARINNNIKRQYFVSCLVSLLPDSHNEHIAMLNEVLRRFVLYNFEPGMRELLLSLPKEVATSVIRFMPQQQGLERVLSLLHLAIIQDKSNLWYFLVESGADLQQKCHDGTSDTLSDLIEYRYKMGSPLRFLESSRIAERQFIALLSLLYQLKNGNKLNQEDVLKSVSKLRNSKSQQVILGVILSELWHITRWCIEHQCERTDFDSILSLAQVIMNDMANIDSQHYHRFSVLAFSRGRYAESLHCVNKIEFDVYKKSQPRNTTVVQFGITRLSLILLDALKMQLPSTVSQHYLQQWEALCDRLVIGDGFPPLFWLGKPVLNLETLNNLLHQLLEFSTPEKKKSGTTYSVDGVGELVTIRDQLATLLSFYDLLSEMERLLIKGSGVGDVLEVFYKAVNRINLMLVKSWGLLELARHDLIVRLKESGADKVIQSNEKLINEPIVVPKEFVDFTVTVERKVAKFSMMLSANDNGKEKAPSSKKASKVKKERHETMTSEKRKSPGLFAVGIRMTPEQIFEIAPPPTTIEVDEQNRQERKKIDRQEKKTDKDNAPNLNEPSDYKTKKVVIDAGSFPALPQKKAVCVELKSKEISFYRSPASPFHVIAREVVEILRRPCFGRKANNIFYAYLTGGAVRNALMHRAISGDYDIIVDLEPAELEATLNKEFGASQVEKKGRGKKNSWRVKYHDIEIDFCCMKDINPDFSCNAIKWHPDIRELKQDGSYGDAPGNLVIDDYYGQQDIKNKVLRFADSSRQDFAHNNYLIFRVIRFERELGFALHPSVIEKMAARQDDIKAMPYVVGDREKLHEQYQKMLKAYGGPLELHAVLKKQGLFQGISAIVKECKDNEEDIELKNDTKRQSQQQSERV